MSRYEYKVIPAPKKGQRAKGVRGTQQKFAIALQEVMNSLGADGWDYYRTDTLPCEERQGLTGKSTSFQNMLVFRKLRATATAGSLPENTTSIIGPAQASLESSPQDTVLSAQDHPISDTLELLQYGDNIHKEGEETVADAAKFSLGGVTKKS